MLKTFAWTAALLVAGSLSAIAQDMCQAPAMPVPVDGNTASEDQIRASIKASNDYITASNTYQQCIKDYLAAQQADADKNKTPVDPMLVQAENAKVGASQDSKQKAAAQISGAIDAYKKAHPG